MQLIQLIFIRLYHTLTISIKVKKDHFQIERSVSIIPVSLPVSSSLAVVKTISILVVWVVSIFLAMVMRPWLSVLMVWVLVVGVWVFLGTIVIRSLIDLLRLSKVFSFILAQTSLVFPLEVVLILWNKNVIKPGFVISCLWSLIFWLIVPLVDRLLHAQLPAIDFVENSFDCQDGGGLDVVYLVVVPEGGVGLLVEGHAVVVDGLNEGTDHRKYWILL